MLPRPIAAVLAALVLAGVHAGPCKPAGLTSLSTEAVDTSSTATTLDTTATTTTSTDESTTTQTEDQTSDSTVLTLETTSASQSIEASSSGSTTQTNEQSSLTSDSTTSTLETTSSSQDENTPTITTVDTTSTAAMTTEATSTTSTAPPCVEPDTGDNLFRNPSFDSVCNANKLDPAPWKVDSGGTIVKSYVISSNKVLAPASGDHFLSFYNVETTTKYLQQTIHYLEPGRRYLFSVNLSQRTEFAGSGKLWRTFKIDGVSYDDGASGTTGGAVWSQQYALFTPTSDTMEFSLGFFNSGSWRASVFVDNLSMVPYSPRCTQVASTPSGKSCALRGAAQQASGRYIANGISQTTLEFCAETCRQTSGASVADLAVSTSYGAIQAYYDIDCFECAGNAD
ncbi:hypothetical protein AK830_g4910 [Neonectria ditissima]|uniref:CBM-cenC domain-containing protein n=1 Tax=Neonectria ditissima TaxID=78410 RepID=A0A0P7BMF0_9HYPO|nr:hypothetical protein AK830_g4910 [Neonectria ditissima]